MIYKPTILESDLKHIIPTFTFTPNVRVVSRSISLTNGNTTITYKYGEVVGKTIKGRTVVRNNKSFGVPNLKLGELNKEKTKTVFFNEYKPNFFFRIK